MNDLGMNYVQAIGLPSTDIRSIIAGLIRTILGLLGMYLVLQIMWGGFKLMTHGGKEDKITEAKAHIFNNVIGMIIIMCSSSIANYVVNAAMNAAQSR